MPKQVLYSATVPLGAGDLVAKLGGEVDSSAGPVPYFVSLPYSKPDTKMYSWAAWGAILHVIGWAAAFTFDILAMTKIDSKADTELMEYWIYGIVILGLGLGFVVLSMIVHKFAPIKEGSMPPALLSVITAGVTLSQLFAFLSLLKHTQLVDASHQKDLRHFLIWGLVSKLYVSSCLRNNIIGAK